MNKWLTPKDLKHSFDIEPLVDEFIKTCGGDLVSELISKSPKFKNADYIFLNEKVVIELKCLQNDFPNHGILMNKVTAQFEKWLSNGEITNEMLFDYSKLPRNHKRQIQKIYTEPLRRIIKKANVQLKSTAEHFSQQNNSNIILIVNNGLYSIEPSLILYLISNILLREFSGIAGFIYLTINSYVAMPNDPIARQV